MDPATGVDSEEEPRHKCATCKSKFWTKNQLHRHIRQFRHQCRWAPPPEVESQEENPPGLQPESDTEDEFTGCAYGVKQCSCCQPVVARRSAVDVRGVKPEDTTGSGEVPPPTEEAGIAETLVGSIDKSHPGPKLKSKDITARDQQWTDIGSGVFARTFRNAHRLATTSKGGPPVSDIQSRKVWSLSTGKLIDECDIENVSDAELHRWLPQPDDIRVEVTLRSALKLFQRTGPDIAEIFSQPRVCQEVDGRSFGGDRLRPGWSLDLTTRDPATGERWDLSRPEVQARVRKLVRDTQPFCVIGSPPCTFFSRLQELNKHMYQDNATWMAKSEENLEQAKRYVRFCVKIYNHQREQNRYFLHEHPWLATSWMLPDVSKLENCDDVFKVRTDMCQFGMVSRTAGVGSRLGPVLKPTGF